MRIPECAQVLVPKHTGGNELGCETSRDTGIPVVVRQFILVFKSATQGVVVIIFIP